MESNIKFHLTNIFIHFQEEFFLLSSVLDYCYYYWLYVNLHKEERCKCCYSIIVSPNILRRQIIDYLIGHKAFQTPYHYSLQRKPYPNDPNYMEVGPTVFEIILSGLSKSTSPKDDPELIEYELTLKHLSLKIGSVIAYFLIRAMSPELIKKINQTQQITTQKYMDELIEEWLTHLISPIDYLRELKKSILESINRFRSDIPDQKKSTSELQDVAISKLLCILPYLSTNFQETRRYLRKFRTDNKEKKGKNENASLRS